MLAAPDKSILPAHSRDVCPWTGTCPVHAAATPTFADIKRGRDARRLARKTLAVKARGMLPCCHCGGPRPEGKQLKKAGRTLPVCVSCWERRQILFGVGVGRYLSRTYRASLGAPA